jgi:hypothetical protein
VRLYNQRYEAKRSASYVRGPRITKEAAERLRELAFLLGMHPCDVVSMLVLATHADRQRIARLAFQKRERLSDAEMAAFDGVVFPDPEIPFIAPAATACVTTRS